MLSDVEDILYSCIVYVLSTAKTYCLGVYLFYITKRRNCTTRTVYIVSPHKNSLCENRFNNVHKFFSNGISTEFILSTYPKATQKYQKQYKNTFRKIFLLIFMDLRKYLKTFQVNFVIGLVEAIQFRI